jgi:serine phosphatase RsbU (regulator of sigma subunit)
MFLSPEIHSIFYFNALLLIFLSFVLVKRIKTSNREKEDLKMELLRHKQMVEKGLSQIASLRSRSNVLENELSMARDIQLAMIPLKPVVENIQSLYLPMGKVGGDFFDIITLNENEIGIFICDVTGHGIPAALITVMIKSMILVGITELNQTKGASWLMEPDRFIRHMNNVLIDHLQDNFTTAFYGIYNKYDKSFKFSSAAHPPPIILHYTSDGEPVTLSFLNVSPQAPPFGVYLFAADKPVFGVNRVVLTEHTRLLFYSDGLMDNVGYDYLNSQAGLESFKQTILYDYFMESKDFNLLTMMETLSIQLLLHKDLGLEDDVCVVVLEIDFKI